ncbi:MAG: ABC transporter ATP-binding protein [Chloroflexi bacterium]|nr:ABC transporter ATP-binding protein [Chloroflexota bacterium]
MESRFAVSVQHLGKSYGSVRVLDDITFDVRHGSCVALLGGNGAGKTTTLKCLLGVVPFEGAVEVEGVPTRTRGKDARRNIGYVPQIPAFGEQDTCAAALSFIAELRRVGKERVGWALETANLSAQSAMKVGELSGGMRQRLALAAAALSDPPVLLLDEPASSLDSHSRRDLHEMIGRLRGEGKTIILSTHVLDSLEHLADQVLVLDRGRLAFAGSVGELSARVRGNRFVVNLNGNSPGDFMSALLVAGIPAERVTPAALPWEEMLLAASEPDPAAREERA